jgi:hypothetical protein
MFALFAFATRSVRILYGFADLKLGRNYSLMETKNLYAP